MDSRRSRRGRDVSPGEGYGLGGVFLLAGSLVVMVATGGLAADEASIHAPRWVIGVMGGIFALCGVTVVYHGARSHLDPGWSPKDRTPPRFLVVSSLTGSLILTSFAAVMGWVAFGPGDRVFSGGLGIVGVFVSVSSTVQEAVGRAVFGLVAVLAGAGSLWSWIHGLRRLGERLRRDLP